MNQGESDEAVIRSIHDTFGGVTREGGISWAEAHALDDYASEEELEEARKKDHDVHWEELVDDETWDPDRGFAWFYLDPVGFRYYLPAGMVRTARAGYDQGVREHLSVPKSGRRTHMARWSGLDEAQCQCVRRFLLYMGAKGAGSWR